MDYKEKVFSDFYEKNFDKLLKFLDYTYPNLHDPESQLQDTFIKFYESYYEGWDSTKSELFTYFVNYLKMSTLNTIKQKQKNTPISLDIEYDIGSKVVTLKDILIQDDSTNGIDDKLDIFNKIVDNLEIKWIDKLELLMLYVKGLSYEEISKEKSIPLSQVKNHIRLIRIYFCDEYSKITGKKIEFTKEAPKNKLAYNQYKRNYKQKKKLLNNSNL